MRLSKYINCSSCLHSVFTVHFVLLNSYVLLWFQCLTLAKIFYWPKNMRRRRNFLFLYWCHFDIFLAGKFQNGKCKVFWISESVILNPGPRIRAPPSESWQHIVEEIRNIPEHGFSLFLLVSKICYAWIIYKNRTIITRKHLYFIYLVMLLFHYWHMECPEFRQW